MQDLADSNAYHFTLNDGGMFLQNICVAPHHLHDITTQKIGI